MLARVGVALEAVDSFAVPLIDEVHPSKMSLLLLEPTVYGTFAPAAAPTEPGAPLLLMKDEVDASFSEAQHQLLQYI